MTGDHDRGDDGLWQEAHEHAEAAAAARRYIIDRFLLAVIDQHPVEGSSREQRLADAKGALFGMAKPKGRSHADDHALLMEMAHAYVSERCDLELRIPDEDLTAIADAASIRELARTAAQQNPGQSLDSTIDRLRKKFHAEKSAYIRMAQYSIERDERWRNSEIGDLLRALRLADRALGIDGEVELQRPREY